MKIRYDQIGLASLIKLAMFANVLGWTMAGIVASIAYAFGIELFGPGPDIVAATFGFVILGVGGGVVSGLLFFLGALLLRLLVRRPSLEIQGGGDELARVFE